MIKTATIVKVSDVQLTGDVVYDSAEGGYKLKQELKALKKVSVSYSGVTVEIEFIVMDKLPTASRKFTRNGYFRITVF